MIIQALKSHLEADSAVAALIEGVYPIVIPETASPPCITYTVDDDVRERTLGGEGPYRMVYFDLNYWAEKYATAIAIAAAVENALIDYRGTLGATSPSITVDHLRLERRLPDDFEADTKLWRVSEQFVIGYNST